MKDLERTREAEAAQRRETETLRHQLNTLTTKLDSATMNERQPEKSTKFIGASSKQQSAISQATNIFLDNAALTKAHDSMQSPGKSSDLDRLMK